MFLVEPDLISLYREVNLVSKFRKHWSLFFVFFFVICSLISSPKAKLQFTAGIFGRVCGSNFHGGTLKNL